MPYECTIRALSTTERHVLGEGPYWDSANNRLYIVDLINGDFVCYDIKSGDVSKRHFDNEMVTFVIPYEADPNKFIVSKNSGSRGVICELDWNEGSLKDLANVEPDLDTRFNDGKCDTMGRLWTGTMGSETSPGVLKPEQGSLYKFDGHRVVHQDSKITLSNGITWSLDQKTMYYVDSGKRHVYGYDFDLANGQISNRRVVFDFASNADICDEELPDGMTIDENGNLWVASFFGGRVLHIDPRTSTLIDYIRLPAEQITSLCFGGEDMTTMYITSAKFHLSPERLAKQPEAGATFEVKLANPIRGVPSQPYRHGSD